MRKALILASLRLAACYLYPECAVELLLPHLLSSR